MVNVAKYTIHGYYGYSKWPFKWVTGVLTLLIGVITPLVTGRATL